MNTNAMSTLVQLLVKNQGVLSRNKRKMFVAKGYSDALLDQAEQMAQEVLLSANAPADE